MLFSIAISSKDWGQKVIDKAGKCLQHPIEKFPQDYETDNRVRFGN